MEEKKTVRVDYNEAFRKEFELSSTGQLSAAEGYQMKMNELKKIQESGIDYCSCPEACPHHGKCWECVLIHRGHRDHLPYCFWDMINERLYPLQRLTEGSLMRFEPHDGPCEACGGCPKKED
jgi:hypothetical protein